MRDSRSSMNSNCIFVIPASDAVELLVSYKGMKWSNENIDEERLRSFSEKCEGFNITFFENTNGKILMFSRKGMADDSVEIYFEGIFMEELPCAFFDKDSKTYDNFSLPASTTELMISVSYEEGFSVEWIFEEENDHAENSIEEDEGDTEEGPDTMDASGPDGEEGSQISLEDEKDPEDEGNLDEENVTGDEESPGDEKEPEEKADVDGETDPEDEEVPDEEKNPENEEDPDEENVTGNEENPDDEKKPDAGVDPDAEKALDDGKELIDETDLDDVILRFKKTCEELTLENDRLRARAEELADNVARLEIRIQEMDKNTEPAPGPDEKDREIIELNRLVRQLADDRFNALYVETGDTEIDSLTAAVSKQKKVLEEKKASKARLEQELDIIESATAEVKDKITDLMKKIDKAESIQNECAEELDEKQRRITILLADLGMDLDALEMYSVDDTAAAVISEAEALKVRLEDRLESLVKDRQRDCDERSNQLKGSS